MAYKHEGFWQCMDTIRDKRLLETLWDAGTAPWAMWEKRSDRVPSVSSVIRSTQTTSVTL
jgi:glucose-1-phosphate cytidylyltransferase